MFRQRHPQFLETISLLAFAKGLCVCVGAFLRQAVYNSILAFTSCLQRASRSSRRDDLRPFQVYSEHSQSPIRRHGLPESLEYFGAFQSLPQTCGSSTFPLIFWGVRLLFASLP